MQVNLGPGTAHPNHQAARLAYAVRIITFLGEHIPRAKAANLAVMDDASWYRICTLAGEKNMPAKATISTIIGMVYGREMAIEAIQASLAGPVEPMFSRITAHDPEAEMV